MTQRTYCRAYPLSNLREYPGWRAITRPEQDGLDDDSVTYIWDDFTVVTDPVDPDADVLVAEPTADWREYCREVLEFEVPAGLAETPTSQ